MLSSFGHCVPLGAGKMQDAGAKAKAVTLQTDFTDAQDTLAFSSPQSFETALVTLGQWKQTGPQTLRIEDGAAALNVQIDTGGLAFTVVPTEINEGVHTKKLPVRLAITLESPVEQATVAMKITPAE